MSGTLRQMVVDSLMKVGAVDIGVFIGAAVLCWLLGWRTPYQYGTMLIIATVAIILLGTLSVFGGYSVRTDFEYQYGRSASQVDIGERNRRDLADVFATYSFLIQAVMTAILPGVVGTWLQFQGR